MHFDVGKKYHAQLVPLLSCCSIYTAPHTQQHFCSQHSRLRFQVAAFTLLSYLRCRLRTAALTIQLSRGRSAGGRGPLGPRFPTPSTTPASGSRGWRVGKGVRQVFEKRCCWVGWGGMHVISPKGVCEGKVKYRGCG